MLIIRYFQQGDWSALSTGCLSVGRVFRIQGSSPSKAPTHLLSRLFGRRVTCRIRLQIQMQTQTRGLQMHLIQACHWLPCRRRFVYPLIHVCIAVLHLSTGNSFLKTQVLYYQVNFLSVLFSWSKSDILWPVRFMAAFPQSFSGPINTSGYKPSSFVSFVASITVCEK